MNDAKLGDFLAKLGVISPQQLYTAREAQAANGGKLASILTNLGFVSEEELARLAATALRLPYIALEQVSVPKDVHSLLPREQARKAKGVLVKVDGKKYYLATCDPVNVQAFDELQFVLGGRVFPVVAAEVEVIRAIGHYYGERVLPDRPFDLVKSNTLNFDKPEMFDIKGARAAKNASTQAKVTSAPSNDDVLRNKAAQAKLSAAASQMKRPEAPSAAPVAAKANPGITITDAPAIKAPLPVAPSKPVAGPVPVAAPVQAPKPAVPPSKAHVEDAMPSLLDEDELHTPVVHGVIEDEVLEVVDLGDEHIEDELTLVAEADEPEAPLASPSPVAESMAPPPAPAAGSGDDLLSLFGGMSFGADAPLPGTSAQSNAEADELAKLFMGALGGEPAPANATGEQESSISDMAAELAHLLLDQTEFTG